MIQLHDGGHASAAGALVLEMASSAAAGRGWPGRAGRLIVGGNLPSDLLERALAEYGDRVVRLDADRIPVAPDSLDVAVLFDTPAVADGSDAVLLECRRVIRPGGLLLLCLINQAWPVRGAGHRRGCASLDELAAVLARTGFRPERLGAYPGRVSSVEDAPSGFLRRLARAVGIANHKLLFAAARA